MIIGGLITLLLAAVIWKLLTDMRDTLKETNELKRLIYSENKDLLDELLNKGNKEDKS